MGWIKKSTGGSGGGGGGNWTKSKKIAITGEILAGTTINANLAGVNYTISGDDVNFIDVGTFNSDLGLYIIKNGIDQEKGADIIYVNTTSFELAEDVDIDDEIILYFGVITGSETPTTMGNLINIAVDKVTPVDTDVIAIRDVVTGLLNKVTLTNLKAVLKTYFDTLYSALTMNALGALIAGGTAKATPIDADSIAISDSADTDKGKKTTFTNLKAFFKTYFDTLYSTTAGISDSVNRRYCTDAEKTVIGNTSNTNTGDETNATIKTKLGAVDTDSDGYLTYADWNKFNTNQLDGTATFPLLPVEGQECRLKNHATLANGKYIYTGSAWVEEITW